MNMISLLRLFTSIWRFNTLKIANWYFRDWPINSLVNTVLFGYMMPIDVRRSSTHRLLALVGERLIPEIKLLMNGLSAGDTVIDVGANIGYYAALFARTVGTHGKVICIEPERNNLVELERFVRNNNLSIVEIHDVAVGEAPGTVKLDSGLNGRISTNSDTQQSVKVIPLDKFDGERIRLVKIDVEGYEGQVLAGMRSLIEKQRPYLFIEIHPELLVYGYSVDNLIDMVTPWYGSIRFFENVQGVGVIEKFSARYISGGGIRELYDGVRLRRLCLTGERRETFWMVCQ